MNNYFFSGNLINNYALCYVNNFRFFLETILVHTSDSDSKFRSFIPG